MATGTDSLKGDRVMSAVDSPEPVVSSSLVRSNGKGSEYGQTGSTEPVVPAPFEIDGCGRAVEGGSYGESYYRMSFNHEYGYN